MALAVAGGLAAALLGAVIWAAITVITNMEVGYVVVGIAFMVGWAVKTFGRGSETAYGIVGALCTIFGIVAGKVFTLVWLVASANSLPIIDVVSKMDWSKAANVIGTNLGPIDFIFAALALSLGFKYSKRK